MLFSLSWQPYKYWPKFPDCRLQQSFLEPLLINAFHVYDLNSGVIGVHSRLNNSHAMIRPHLNPRTSDYYLIRKEWILPYRAKDGIKLKILRGDIYSVLSMRALNPITSVPIRVRQREIWQNRRKQCGQRSGDRSDEVPSQRKPIALQSLKRQRRNCPLVSLEGVQPSRHFGLTFLSSGTVKNTFLLI